MGRAVILPKGSFTSRIHLLLFSRFSNGRNHKNWEKKHKVSWSKGIICE